MDIAQVVEKVENEILDLPPETQDSILDWVNQAVREAEDDHNFLHMESSQDYTTTEATRLIATKPADWKEAFDPPYLTANDGGTTEIDFAGSGSSMRRQYASNADGEPQFVLETPTQLHAWPLPDALSDYPDGDYRLTVPYYAYSDTLAISGTTTNWWTENYPWYLIYKAASYAFLSNYDSQKAAERGALAANLFAQAKRKDKRAKIPRRATLGVSRGAFGAGQRPRVGWRRGGLR